MTKKILAPRRQHIYNLSGENIAAEPRGRKELERGRRAEGRRLQARGRRRRARPEEHQRSQSACWKPGGENWLSRLRNRRLREEEGIRRRPAAATLSASEETSRGETLGKWKTLAASGMPLSLKESEELVSERRIFPLSRNQEERRESTASRNIFMKKRKKKDEKKKKIIFGLWKSLKKSWKTSLEEENIKNMRRDVSLKKWRDVNVEGRKYQWKHERAGGSAERLMQRLSHWEEKCERSWRPDYNLEERSSLPSEPNRGGLLSYAIVILESWCIWNASDWLSLWERPLPWREREREKYLKRGFTFYILWLSAISEEKEKKKVIFSSGILRENLQWREKCLFQ